MFGKNHNIINEQINETIGRLEHLRKETNKLTDTMRDDLDPSLRVITYIETAMKNLEMANIVMTDQSNKEFEWVDQLPCPLCGLIEGCHVSECPNDPDLLKVDEENKSSFVTI